MDKLLQQPWAGALIPFARAFVRFAPPSALKENLWERWIDPYLAWRDHRFVARTAAGRMSGTTRDILQQYLYYFGLWEPHVTAFLRRRLQPGDGFVDVGANIGYFSLLAARQVGPNGLVLSVEAAPEIFQMLNANIARNRAAVRAVNLAASDRPGTLAIYAGDAGNCGGTSIAPTTDARPTAMVAAEPVDEILTPAELAQARLVKIDVEGAEASVLAGMARLLATGRRDCEFLVEIHPEQLRQLGRSPEEVLAVFQAAGFHAYALENDYDASAYLRPLCPKLLPRFAGAVEYDTNIVFSRTDTEAL